jgi:hypothetical protein
MEQPRHFEDLSDIQCFRISPDNEEENRPYDYFNEEIQAAYLAGQTIHYMNTSNGSSGFDFEDLNGQIMAHLGDMFERAPGSWRPFCSAIAILLV